MIGGKRINDEPPQERNVAMVFQSYALYPHKTVYKNIAFPLEVKGFAKSDIEKGVRDVAELLGLSKLLSKMPSQLSGGEKQRVALGRAIVREPLLFLMDEPLSNLDAQLRAKMRAEIKRLQKTLKITTVYVTHDQTEALSMADKIVVMRNGEIQQIGSAHYVYREPRNIFVAEFIGAMNLTECVVKEDGIDTGDFLLPCNTELKGKSVILGIRPEDIEIREKGIKARVEIAESTGAETILHISTGSKRWRVKASEVKDEVEVYFPPENICLFDPVTTERLYKRGLQ
jgi:multiple sugar transport system ATP-binding protein